MNRPCNVLLTGLPRSGTTLVCNLLSAVPNTVALHEPLTPGKWDPARGAEGVYEAIDLYIEKTRQSLLIDGKAETKAVGGKVPDNPISDQYTEGGLRKSVANRETISIEKPLTPDFLLAIKQNAAFTAFLKPLRERYEMFAIMRNPLGVLNSWQSVDISIARGHVPAAERFRPELKEALEVIPDVLDRQFYILNWFFEEFRQIPEDHIIRYEEVVASHGRSLAKVAPDAATLERPLESKNRNKLYNQELYAQLGERLLNSNGAYWHFYTRESVEALLAKSAEQTPPPAA